MSSSKDFQFCFICQNRFSFSVSNNYHFGSDYSSHEKNSFGATFDTEKDRRTELTQRFCTLASRYLNFDFNFNDESDSKLKKNTLIKATARKRTGGGGVSAINSVNTRNSSKRRIENENEAELDPEIDQCQCCPMCFPIIQSFCDFYEQWAHIQVKLDQGTRRIAELMRLRLQSPKRSGQVGDFRAKFLANVTKIPVRRGHQQRYENIPKRSLSQERRDANTEDDDDDFEADTGSMNMEAFDSDRFSGNEEDIDADDKTPGTSALRRRVIRIIRDGERNSAKTVASKSAESTPTHFKCRFCGRMFTKKHKWLLQEHERMHTGERPFKCGICGKRFNRRAACRVHQRSAHGKLKGEAEILKEVQSQTEMDEDHVDLEKRNSASNPGKKLLMPRFKCGICRKEFLHSFSCSRHLRISHRIEKAEERKGKIRTIERNENDAEVDVDVDMTPVTSDFEVSNVEIVPYIKTERAEDEDSEIQDGDDDRDLDSNLDMAVEVHNQQNDPDFSPTRQQKKSPKTKRRQVGVTEYACQYCGKRVFRKRDLENHERVHTKKRPFKCPKCEQTFAQKSGCKKHMIMKHNVAEEETLEMEIVQEELEVVGPVPTDSLEGTLTVKKIIRPKFSKPELDPSIELPLKCQFCGKGFKLKHNWLLVEHERIHTGERPFKCSICGKRYNRRAKCRYHQRGVHKGKGKVIGPDDQVNDDDLEVEVLTDQEDKNKKGKEKKFKCGVCGREFSQSFSCSRHVQTVHKIEKVLERQAMVVSLSLDSNKQIVVGKKSRPSKYETDSEEDDNEDDYEEFDQMEVPALPAPAIE